MGENLQDTSAEPMKLTYRLLEKLTDCFAEERKLGSGAFGVVYKDLCTRNKSMGENLQDTSAEPMKLTYQLLEKLTDCFAEERKLGSGAFGVVYKGVHQNGEEIAVKVFRNMAVDDSEFQKEFQNLRRLKHQNIVELKGYCNESEETLMEVKGQQRRVETLHMALCLEYVDNGSLGKHLFDEFQGLNWHLRYKIIKGICEGLKYLREGLDQPIWHLDLKPGNILLDKNMVPKIADFGLSRLFGEEKTKTTINHVGTCGYQPPEFVRHHVISDGFDIFSLGVIIVKIMTGREGYSSIADMTPEKFVQHVHNNWKKRLQERLRHSSLEVYCQQVKTCIDIALKCLTLDRHDRPSIQEIVSNLNKTETMIADSGLQIKQSHDESNSTSKPSSAQMAEAVFLAVKKIGTVLEEDAARAIKPIIAKLSGKVTNLKELPEKFEEIRKQLTMMDSVIQQIGTTYLTDVAVETWIAEVRKLAYHVEDVMDKYSYHALQPEEEWFLKKYFVKGSYYVKVFSDIADEVIKVEKEIQQVIKLKEQWLHPSQLIPIQLAESGRQRYQDSFPDLVKDEDLVGIDGNRRLLTGWLYSDVPDNAVITVSGMGGLGKTTLVTNVYEREKVNFTAHAWIVVSQTYTVEALLRKLLRKIGYMEQANLADMDVQDLKGKLKEKLKDRKCLIVLDDVWDQKVYFQMQDAFQNLQEIRIIITTRENDVASLATSACRLKLQPLNGTDAFELFCRRAFYNKKEHKCPNELEKVATSIVHRCHGLPLAIVTIGSLLSSRRPVEYVWNQMYNQFGAELVNNDHVRAILNLSYHDLSGVLRSCLLYCSLFPEGYKMTRESLVRMWVAEGFVRSKEKNTPEEVAEGNLMDLIHRNMLEVVENDEVGRVDTCKMHGFVRVLALSIAKEERFGSANDIGTMLLMDKEVRRLSTCGWSDNSASRVKFLHLRTLISLKTVSSPPNMLLSILSGSSYLTVLELQDSEITEVPAFIGDMFNLRYIGLRRTKVKSLPESIEKLSNLQTLDIKQTNIEKLPRGIVKVKKLRHLLADRYADEKQEEFRYFIGMQAPKDLSNLEDLQTLETVEASKDLAEQLKKLIQLRSVWIDNISATDCANLFATLSNMPLLSSLLLSARDENEALCFEALQPRSTELRRLIIRGQWAKGTLEYPIFSVHGTYLEYLALSWCHLGEDPLRMLTPHLLNLTYLRLDNMRSAKILVLSARSFPHLKTLVLKHMPDVNQLNIRDGALRCIEGLYIVSLSKLDKVPQGIESLHSLKKLWLLSLHKDFRTQWDNNGMHQKMQHVPEVRV